MKRFPINNRKCLVFRLYPGVSDALKFASSRVYIVTTKQSRFADALLRELAGVTIPPERIYGLGTGPKVEVLKQLQKKPEHQGLTLQMAPKSLQYKKRKTIGESSTAVNCQPQQGANREEVKRTRMSPESLKANKWSMLFEEDKMGTVGTSSAGEISWLPKTKWKVRHRGV
ncbi:hypothetical protein Fmac_017865 [Flemingia macrophylla]|uniref:Uncharacterized protein n=1 Tax=Flemingia macrophylla TaxID=520843 RepID=A0ABD1M3D4_9FABA